MEDATRHYLISGRVQGVGFRAFTSRKASELALRGWVRNLHDGRVEALGQGPRAQLEVFSAHLKSGPPHGQVDSVVVTEMEHIDLAINFEVRKDGSKPCCKNS